MIEQERYGRFTKMFITLLMSCVTLIHFGPAVLIRTLTSI